MNKRGVLVLLVPLLYLALAGQEKNLANLEDRLKTASGAERIGILNDLAEGYLNRETEQSKKYGIQALQLAEAAKDRHGMALAHKILGIACRYTGDLDMGMDHLQQALPLFHDLGDQKNEAQALREMGNIYYAKNEFIVAQKFYLDAIAIAEKIGDLDSVSRCLNNMGVIKFQLKEYPQALAYLQWQQVADMQGRYETLKKQKEIEVLKKNNEILDKDRRLKAATRNVLILAFVLVLIVLGFLVKKYFFLFAFWKRQKYVGHYRLADPIGSGGMGTIYRAHDILDRSRTVAVKVLREELTEDAEYIKRFKQEAQIIDSLEHPNVVRIYERGEASGRLFIAMELLQGRTLDKVIAEESPLEWSVCFHVMNQVTFALDLIHGKRIVHRDLKPANIMLVEQGGDRHFVKLMDFGLAKSTLQTTLTGTGIVVGTVQYMAPEQLSRSEYSTASDVYSLGVTFYEMATARKAFYGETPTDVMRQVLETLPIEPARYRPDVPAPLNALIMRMMAKSFADRPSLSEVLEYLKNSQEKAK